MLLWNTDDKFYRWLNINDKANSRYNGLNAFIESLKKNIAPGAAARAPGASATPAASETVNSIALRTPRVAALAPEFRQATASASVSTSASRAPDPLMGNAAAAPITAAKTASRALAIPAVNSRAAASVRLSNNDSRNVQSIASEALGTAARAPRAFASNAKPTQSKTVLKINQAKGSSVGLNNNDLGLILSSASVATNVNAAFKATSASTSASRAPDPLMENAAAAPITAANALRTASGAAKQPVLASLRPLNSGNAALVAANAVSLAASGANYNGAKMTTTSIITAPFFGSESVESSKSP